MTEEPASPVNAPSRAVAAVNRFVAAHGGSARAVVQGVSLDQVRITLVGADGNLGDVVVHDVDIANAVVEASKASSAHWDRELSGSVQLTTANRMRMAHGRIR